MSALTLVNSCVLSRNLFQKSNRNPIAWLLSWADSNVQLITPGKKRISLERDIKPNKAFVYFIFNSDSYAIKIGRATDVEKRLQSLQTSSPVPLKILKTIPIDSIKKAQEVETYLHTKFRHLKMSGEWFRADPELRNYITRCDESYFQNSCLIQPQPRSSIRLSEL
ncbi:GIY-YIG nuclease family protein [Nostoc sp. 'Peltigera membranacea cyanobiont' N6]|uniref:GIY-YIG nuclease family protein n=1 Tax=Nostoc sp. 'Peltigera membranacea cyanobiont' N6 TaxID=1261031 RepID=UPI0015E4710B|nr:GIY-YIG nuclease family protein [Nostoc sp. 'Peltigera membranacea cyanobiont' N6]